MCDDVELYRSKQTEVDIVYDLSDVYLVLDDIHGECGTMLLTPDIARQIGLGLIKWSDAQRAGRNMSKPIELYTDGDDVALEIVVLYSDEITYLVIDDNGSYNTLRCEIGPSAARQIARRLIEWADAEEAEHGPN